VAKGNAPGTISPFRFVAGTHVFGADAIAAVEQSAYAAGYTPPHLGGALAGVKGWADGTHGSAGHEVRFITPLATWITVYDFIFRVSPNVSTLRFGAVARFTGGDIGEVRLVVGGVTRALFPVLLGTNGVIQSSTYLASAIGGAGEYRAQVGIRLMGGTTAVNQLVRWFHHAEPVTVASNWPDPSG
jgi:hypothetical protein